jgi:hypothetical protein
MGLLLMKQLFLIAIALVIPLYFGLLIASSAYHRRKKREQKHADPKDSR